MVDKRFGFEKKITKRGKSRQRSAVHGTIIKDLGGKNEFAVAWLLLRV